jgi:hypothetical protein
LTPLFFIGIILGGKQLIMAIKLMLLKTGETLITDAKEVVQEEQVRGYMLERPHFIRTQEKTALMESDTGKGNYELDIILTPWMILSSDTSFVITADTVSTICEPIPSVKEMYLNKTTASMEVEEEVPLSETEVLNG